MEELQRQVYTPERRQELLANLRDIRAAIQFAKANERAGIGDSQQLGELQSAETKIVRILDTFYPGQPKV